MLGDHDGLDLEAAVLFADLSGFSRRANELLSQHGSEGAARLATLLTAAFSQLVECIHAHGGEVVRYAGDALLAWWPGDQVVFAAAAGAELGQLTLPSGLKLRIGFGHGPVRAQRLGGHRGHFELLLTGPAVQAACAGGALPEPADVFLPERSLDVPLVREEYVPAFILRRVRHAGWEPELRQISAVFVGLPELTGAVVEQLQVCAEQHFGVLDKVVVDDKGAYGLILFGLPATLAPYRPDRALRCAVALQALGFAGGLGIGTGRCFSGLVGPARRQELAVLGPALNRAARLMQASGRGALADAASVRGGSRVRVTEVDALELRGFDQPVAAFRVLGLHPESHDTATHVLAGRQVELAALSDLLGATSSATLVFQGEAGIGKSRLLAVAASACDDPPLRVVGDAVQRGTPLYSLRGAVLGIIGASEELADRLADHPDLAELHPLLGPVLGIELPDTPATATLQGFVRASRTQDLLVELLRRASPGGATVLVEDAHWVDQASLAVLARLRRTVDPIRMVVATRPEIDETGAWISLTEGARWLSLTRLSRGGLARLLEEKVGGALPDALVAWVSEHSDGNPFFALELLAGLVEGGHLSVSADGVRAPDPVELADYEPPATVEGAVTWRIDALGTAARALLSTASVLGSSFTLDELIHVHPRRSEVDDGLRALLKTDLLEHSGQQLRFSHVIVRDVAYGRMLEDRRRALHTAAAEWLDAQPERERRGRMPLLAWHWSHCDEDRALEALEWCWLDARREGAMHEAYRFLARATELDARLRSAGHSGATAMRRAGWERRMAAAVAGMGEPRRIEAHARRSLVLLERGPPTERWGGAALKALIRRLGQSFLPSAMWRVADQDQDAAAEEGMAWTRLAEALFYLKGDPLAMLTSALSAVNAARSSGRVVPVTTAWGQLGLVCGAVGLDRLALGCLAEARAIADELQEPTEQSNAWLSHTMVHSLSCRWDACEPVLDNILPLLRASRNAHLVGPFYSLLAANDYLQGRFERARDRALELRDVAGEVQSVLQLGWSHYHLAQISMALGQHDEALEYAETAARQLRAKEDLAEMVALACIAGVHARRGEGVALEPAMTRLEELLATAQVNSYTRLEGHAGPAEVWLRLGEVDRAEAALVHLEAFSKRFRCGRPRLHLLRGLVAKVRGGKSAPALQKAAALATDYGLEMDLARAKAALGQRDEALALFTRLRCRWHLEQLS